MSDATGRAKDLAAADAAAREQALDVARSWLVQAPAGSGKTELLVQRMLALLAHVDAPERVVATTFTRKAAAEMRARLVSALVDARDGVTPDSLHRARTLALAASVLARDRALGWRLVDYPARLDVGTLDALSARIATQLPVSSALGGPPRPVDRAEELYRVAARRALQAADGDDAHWRTVAGHFDNNADRVVDLLASMLGKRDQWLGPVLGLRDKDVREALERTLAEEVEIELADALGLWPAHSVAELVSLAGIALPRVADEAQAALAAALELIVARANLPEPTVAALPHWRELARWLLTDSGSMRKTALAGFERVGGGAGVEARRATVARVRQWLTEAASTPGLAAAIARIARLPDPAYSPRARAFIDALVHVLPRIAATLLVVFAEEGACDFGEVTSRALTALGSADDPSAVLLAQDMRIEHLLIDEFQDTSRRQLELVVRLTSGWQAGDGRTLFVVGDPMQGIYAFREADVRNFLDAARIGRIGGVALGRLALARNFRSQADLVDHVNATFPPVLAAVATRTSTAVTFGAAIATRAATGERPTFEWASDADDEAARVVAHVRRALAAQDGDVAILVRARSHVAALLPALRAAGIEYDAVKLESLAEHAVSRDLLALARALTQPADRLAWLAMLRAPWCGVRLPDLLAFADAACASAPSLALDDRSLDAALSADGARRVRRVADVIRQIAAARAEPLAARVRAAWLALDGPAAYGTDMSGAVAADAMLDLLSRHDRGGDIDDFDALQDEAQALMADPPAAAESRVKVMTLHAAKGLEFDVVVLPGLGRAPARNPGTLLRWRSREPDRALLVGTPRARDEDAADPVDAWLACLDGDDAAAEAARLWYVAFTRARHRLHLTATGRARVDRKTGAHEWKPPRSDSPLAMFWPVFATSVAPPGPSDMATGQDVSVNGKAPPPFERLPGDFRREPLPVDVGASARAERATSPVAYDWAQADAAAVGTVVHRILAQLAMPGAIGVDAVALAAMRPRVDAELAALGVRNDARVESSTRVLDAIAATLGDAQGRWLFDGTHTEAASEAALSVADAEGVVRIVIDRTFVADGVRWIVDFKTSRHEGGDLAGFLARERVRHAPQLEGYARAIALLDARPIRLALYFPALARLEAWDYVPVLD
ncbi:MAG TPA: UvrD-helicase domain-containing protein [Casimicrobiaceae bacterium]|nr:UvrD-helicase domain-containing protein [Casimicrobiaceae bacterium]